MVNEAEYGLEEQQDQHDHSNDRVPVRHYVQVRRHPNTDAEGADIEKVYQHLENTMNEPQAAERSKSDEDAS